MVSLKRKLIIVGVVALLSAVAAFSIPSANAAITDGMTQTDGLGQIVGGVPVFNGVQNTANNSLGTGNPNATGLNAPYGMDVDVAGHRLFIADRTNNRIIVHTLDSANELSDYEADFVLGQPDFTSNGLGGGQSGMYAPTQVAYDSTKDLLYVSETSRILVFDVATITNGEAAVNVLGQPDFASGSSATTATGMNNPAGLALDETNQLLYNADIANNRVMVYDVDSITNGEAGVNVLGQANFTSSSAATTAAGLSSPQGIALDKTGQRLFVGNNGSNRVSVFDVASITNGEDAVNVIGQPDFATTTGDATQSIIRRPLGLGYDQANDILFVADTDNNRILTFDVTAITDGENAQNVLGQTNFTNSSAGNGDGRLYGPVSVLFEPGSGAVFTSELSSHRIRIFGGVSEPTLTTSVTTTTAAGGGSGGGDDGDGGSPGNPNNFPPNTVTPEIEDAGPNGGDANGDGTPDSEQDNVSSFINPETDDYAVMEAPVICTNETTIVEAEPIDYNDVFYQYPAGLMNFTIECNGTVGGTATVKLIFYGLDQDAADFLGRKFINNNYETLTGSALVDESIGGRAAVSLTYSLVDGGPLDVDGAADGSITDPAGVGFSGSLAATGGEPTGKIALAAMLILAGAGIAYAARRRKLLAG